MFNQGFLGRATGISEEGVPALRSLGAMANVFVIESFVDMLALEAQKDSVAFRMKTPQRIVGAGVCNAP